MIRGNELAFLEQIPCWTDKLKQGVRDDPQRKADKDALEFKLKSVRRVKE